MKIYQPTILIFLTFIFSISFSQNKKDSLDRKQGYWKVFYPNSKHIEHEGNFKDDKPQGLFKYYYEHDTIKAKINFKKDGVAYATLFHFNGKIMAKGKYINQKKDSVWEFYNELGTLINRENYLQGQKHGLCITYYDDGKVFEKKEYILDKKHGHFIQYFHEGKIKGMGYYIDDLPEGYFVYYAPNGTRVSIMTFKNGISHGPELNKEISGEIKNKKLYEYGKQKSDKDAEEYFKNHPEILNNEFGLDKAVIEQFKNKKISDGKENVKQKGQPTQKNNTKKK